MWLRQNNYYSSMTGKPVTKPTTEGSVGYAENDNTPTRFEDMRPGMSYAQMVVGKLILQ